MSAMKDAFQRECEARMYDPCPICERERDAEMEAAHYFGLLAATDPALSATHREATDAEWWAWLLSGGRDC